MTSSDDDQLSIGAFATVTGLSAKALRLYGELGLLRPTRVDESTGYRWYDPTQIERARTIALLRHLDMPLATIDDLLAAPDARAVLHDYWAGIERRLGQRRATVAYLDQLLPGGPMSPSSTPSVTVDVRAVPERALLTALRHVHAAQAGRVLGNTLRAMRSSGPGLPGIAGCPFTIYYGAVSDDSDGPVEIARPVADATAAARTARTLDSAEVRVEAAHDEAFVRVTLDQTGWPAHLPVVDAIVRHVESIGRHPAGPLRTVMIADWRTVGADEPAADLALPLRR
jgi:DNA-binding transcriptional MerR regulator